MELMLVCYVIIEWSSEIFLCKSAFILFQILRQLRGIHVTQLAIVRDRPCGGGARSRANGHADAHDTQRRMRLMARADATSRHQQAIDMLR